MPYYEINALRFCLAHLLRSEYRQDPADYQGLFFIDSLRYWQKTQLAPEEILRQVVGQPPQRKSA